MCYTEVRPYYTEQEIPSYQPGARQKAVMPMPEQLEVDFKNSAEHARFLEETSLSWLKYHFAFFPVVLAVVSLLVQAPIRSDVDFRIVQSLALLLFLVLLIVGLCDVYNQTTTRIGYVNQSRNLISCSRQFTHRSYLQRLIAQPFYVKNTTRYFHLLDFWSARVALVAVANAFALLGALGTWSLSVQVLAQGKVQLLFQIGNSAIFWYILAAILFVIMQFAAFAAVLIRVERKSPSFLDETAVVEHGGRE